MRGEEYADTFDNSLHQDLISGVPDEGESAEANEWEDVVEPALEYAIRDLLGTRYVAIRRAAFRC